MDNAVCLVEIFDGVTVNAAFNDDCVCIKEVAKEMIQLSQRDFFEFFLPMLCTPCVLNVEV